MSLVDVKPGKESARPTPGANSATDTWCGTETRGGRTATIFLTAGQASMSALPHDRLVVTQGDRVDLRDLHSRVHEHNTRRNHTYNHILRLIHSKIHARAREGDTSMWYTMQEYVPGLPMIDLPSCMRYVLTNLHNNGLIARYYFPNSIYINWNPEFVKPTGRRDHAVAVTPSAVGNGRPTALPAVASAPPPLPPSGLKVITLF
jgi:hypothetical protein